MNARNSQTELALERREEEKKRWRTLRNQNGKNVFRNKRKNAKTQKRIRSNDARHKSASRQIYNFAEF